MMDRSPHGGQAIAISM